jgi:hypothetical protein
MIRIRTLVLLTLLTVTCLVDAGPFSLAMEHLINCDVAEYVAQHVGFDPMLINDELANKLGPNTPLSTV